MPSNRTTKAKRASASAPSALRELKPTSRRAKESPAASIAATDEPTGGRAQRQANEQAKARQEIRRARSPGAVGPIGRTVLLIALLTLAGFIAVWVLLSI
jgi:hypothetical protein